MGGNARRLTAFACHYVTPLAEKGLGNEILLSSIGATSTSRFLLRHGVACFSVLGPHRGIVAERNHENTQSILPQTVCCGFAGMVFLVSRRVCVVFTVSTAAFRVACIWVGFSGSCMWWLQCFLPLDERNPL